MTRADAIAQAKEHAQTFKLTAYVHTCKALGYNFRFISPIETLPQNQRWGGKTVAIIFPDGHMEEPSRA